MSAFDFRRCEGYIPQQFIDSNFPVCPICDSRNPCWTLKDTVENAAARVMFRCSECSCILSAAAADLSGIMANSAGSADGKDVRTAYMKVESTGSAQAAKFSAGKEIPISELKGMAASSGQPAANTQNAAPQSQPQQPYAAAPQGYPQQPYAAAPQSQPQQSYTAAPQRQSQQPYAAAPQSQPQQPYAAAPQGYPQQPYAAAPQGYPQQPYAAAPQGYPQQPYAAYTGPRAGKQPLSKLNIAALVLAAFFTLAMIIPLITSNINVIGLEPEIAPIAAGILLVFGICKRDKTGNALFATGLFIFALSTALRNSGDLTIDVCNQFTMPTLAVAGVSYLVNNKTMRTLKLIAMIIVIVASNIWIFWYGFYFLRILAMLAYAALGVCGILFKPAEKA